MQEIICLSFGLLLLFVFVYNCGMEVKVKRFFIIITIVFAILMTPLVAYADVVVEPEIIIAENPAIVIIILIAIAVVATIFLVKLYRRKQGR